MEKKKEKNDSELHADAHPIPSYTCPIPPTQPIIY